MQTPRCVLQTSLEGDQKLSIKKIHGSSWKLFAKPSEAKVDLGSAQTKSEIDPRGQEWLCPFPHQSFARQNHVTRKMEIQSFSGIHQTPSHWMVWSLLNWYDIVQQIFWTFRINNCTELQVERKQNTKKGLLHASVHVWVVGNGLYLCFYVYSCPLIPKKGKRKGNKRGGNRVTTTAP